MKLERLQDEIIEEFASMISDPPLMRDIVSSTIKRAGLFVDRDGNVYGPRPIPASQNARWSGPGKRRGRR